MKRRLIIAGADVLKALYERFDKFAYWSTLKSLRCNVLSDFNKLRD